MPGNRSVSTKLFVCFFFSIVFIYLLEHINKNPEKNIIDDLGMVRCN